MTETERFPEIPTAEMTEEQRAAMAEILAGPRKGAPGPFKAMVRSPKLMRHAQALGAYVRFETDIPPHLRELAILLTARKWMAQFEWYAHAKLARRAGLDGAIIAAVQRGQRPDTMADGEVTVHDFCHDLLHRGTVPDAVYAPALNLLGERGLIDLIATIGYYSLVSMILNVDRTPLPDGETLPLSPLG